MILFKKQVQVIFTAIALPVLLLACTPGDKVTSGSATPAPAQVPPLVAVPMEPPTVAPAPPASSRDASSMLAATPMVPPAVAAPLETLTPTPAPVPSPTPTSKSVPTPTLAPASPAPQPTSTLPTAITPTSLPTSGSGWRQIATPPNGYEQTNVQWIEIDGPRGYKLIGAVFRPPGPGPFPAVVVLHASGGFGGVLRIYGNLFVQSGFLVVVASWFSGSAPSEGNPPSLIVVPQGPPFDGANYDSIKYADAIVKTTRLLPGADGQHIGLFGISRGANAAVLLASTGAGIQAVVADSSEYTMSKPRKWNDTPPIGLVQKLEAPLLILHGTADNTVPIQEARDYEVALRQFNKQYEVRYYEGAPHVVTLTENTYRNEARELAIAFMKKHMIPPGR